MKNSHQHQKLKKTSVTHNDVFFFYSHPKNTQKITQKHKNFKQKTRHQFDSINKQTNKQTKKKKPGAQITI